jgi:hypothetical protein
LTQVTADEELARSILRLASLHVATAEREAEFDPYMAYSALSDAARKALTALLQMQGLRPSRAGGHIAVLEACKAQLDPPLGKILEPLDRMRRIRHLGEYPSVSSAIVGDDVHADIPKAREIVDMAARVVDQLPVFVR